MYSKSEAENGLAPKEESEVMKELAVLMNQTSELRVSLDALEIRLKPILPEIQKTEERPLEAPPVGNKCPLARTIEANTSAIDEMVLRVHLLLNHIRI
jgi:hypothetical protein